MSRLENTIWCDGCGVEITWAPVVRDHQDYCCAQCLAGIRCECDELFELGEDRRQQKQPLNEPALSGR